MLAKYTLTFTLLTCINSCSDHTLVVAPSPSFVLLFATTFLIRHYCKTRTLLV